MREKPTSPTGSNVVENLTWHDQAITRNMREERNGHRGATLWYTGLSGSGKSTIANAVSAALFGLGCQTYVLDGDNVRHGLNKGLGFSPEDRSENLRRVAEVAKLFTDAGMLTGVAFISPYRRERDLARGLQPASFIEVYVKADVATCESRDPKGLYAKARAGEIKGFTGIDDPYEEPENPEITVDTSRFAPDECVRIVLRELQARRIIS